MRLTLSLLFKVDKIPYRFRGKYRKVKVPTLKDLHKRRQDYEREERNMLLLRHPYLTVEQSHGHNAENREKINKEKMSQFLRMREDKYTKEITIAERLEHLKVKEAWD